MSTITAAQVASMPIPKLKQHAVNLGVKTEGLSPDALKKAVIAALNKPAAATGKKPTTPAPAAGKKGSTPTPAATTPAPATGKKLAPPKPGAAAAAPTTKPGASAAALEALETKVAYLFAVLGLDANEHPEDPAEGSSLAVVHLGQSMPEQEEGEEGAEGEPEAEGEEDILAEWRTEDGQLGLTAEIVNGMNMAQLDALAAELELDFGNAKAVPLKRKAVIAYLESLDSGEEEQTIIDGPNGEKAIEWAQDIEGFDGGESVWISREHTDPKKKGAVTKSWHSATVSADPYGADEAGDRYLQVELNDNGEVLYIFSKGVGEAEMVGLVPQE